MKTNDVQCSMLIYSCSLLHVPDPYYQQKETKTIVHCDEHFIVISRAVIPSIRNFRFCFLFTSAGSDEFTEKVRCLFPDSISGALDNMLNVLCILCIFSIQSLDPDSLIGSVNPKAKK